MSNELETTNDLTAFRENLPNMTDEHLCGVIVSFRYLGLLREQSLMAMEELAKRRANGDTFQFEEFVEEKLKTMPKLNTDMRSILKAPGFLSGLGFGFGGKAKQ